MNLLQDSILYPAYSSDPKYFEQYLKKKARKEKIMLEKKERKREREEKKARKEKIKLDKQKQKYELLLKKQKEQRKKFLKKQDRDEDECNKFLKEQEKERNSFFDKKNKKISKEAKELKDDEKFFLEKCSKVTPIVCKRTLDYDETSKEKRQCIRNTSTPPLEVPKRTMSFSFSPTLSPTLSLMLSPTLSPTFSLPPSATFSFEGEEMPITDICPFEDDCSSGDDDRLSDKDIFSFKDNCSFKKGNEKDTKTCIRPIPTRPPLGEEFCPSFGCSRDYGFSCDKCGICNGIFEKDTMYHTKEHSLCSSCYRVECSGCEISFEISKLSAYKGQLTCKNCILIANWFLPSKKTECEGPFAKHCSCDTCESWRLKK